MAEAEPADVALAHEREPGPDARAVAAEAAAREVYQTTKKMDAVVVDGYVMIKHYVTTNGLTQRWRCEHVNKFRCNARGESPVGTTVVVMRQKYTTHNHERNATALKVRHIQNEVKDHAKRLQMTSAATIVDHALRGAAEDVVLAVPRENLLKIASNVRRQAGSRQVNRADVADIAFPDAYKTTSVGDQFLLVDSRTTQPGQSVFFIFASPFQLRELRLRQHWAVDGTFYCTPANFDSVFTIHVHIGHSSVPVAYFLLQDRTEATYRRALTAFVDAANIRFVEPLSIMSDFELAAINALRDTFQMSAIRLCLFHLAQAVFKNIAELGLVRLYRDNATAQELLRCFAALAAVPPEDVVEGLNAIVDELTRLLATGDIDADWEPQLAAFEDYFERTYIRKINRLGNGFDEPRYPVRWWNHYQSILGNLHRTNNAVEGWHHAFNNTFSAPHMALDKFIYRLQNDEDISRQRLLRQDVFPADPLRRRREKRYLVADKHLLALAQRYALHYRANHDILRYLRCIQHHLQKPRFPGEAPDVAEDPLEEVAENEDGADDNNEDGPGGDGARIPRRESHPGRDRHGFEPEERDEGAGQGMRHVGGAAAANVIHGHGGEHRGDGAVDELLPGFSQADAIVRPHHVMRRGHGQRLGLPSSATSSSLNNPSTSAASRRGL